jgi:hypothetical protein
MTASGASRSTYSIAASLPSWHASPSGRTAKAQPGCSTATSCQLRSSARGITAPMNCSMWELPTTAIVRSGSGRAGLWRQYCSRTSCSGANAPEQGSGSPTHSSLSAEARGRVGASGSPRNSKPGSSTAAPGLLRAACSASTAARRASACCHTSTGTATSARLTATDNASRRLSRSGHAHRWNGRSTSFVAATASTRETRMITTPDRGPATGRSRSTR